MIRRFVVACLALWVVLVPVGASAHALGVSRGVYAAEGNDVVVTVVLARGELLGVVPSLDPEHRGVLTSEALVRERPAVGAAATAGIVVVAAGAACRAALEDATLIEEDGVSLRLRHACPSTPAEVTVRVPWLASLSLGHRHFVQLGEATAAVLHRGNEEATLALPQSGAPPSARAHPWALLRMGVEHILTGYDHLVFLVALVLVGGRPRALVAVVTAFTVAHSISLALATFGVLSPSPRLVEPAIALSIAYVGVENLLVGDRSAEKRWRLTFVFGLVHGFGFAGALREIQLPRAQIPRALLLFNLGVEAGQLAVLALVLPLVLLLRRGDRFRTRGVPALSLAVVIAGIAWAVLRIAHPEG